MPLYDFECRRCGERFDALVAPSEAPACPACHTPNARRVFSPFAGPLKIGLRGTAARRSNATRRAREEQRREERARRREQRQDA